jgi:hypothetical protein
MPAMLGEFTQGVQVDPPQRERSQVVTRQRHLPETRVRARLSQICGSRIAPAR